MTNARRSIPRPIARAFTLVELLVVVSIIVILLGILIPATSLILGNARASANMDLLRTLSDGAYAFNQDFTYYPPLLAPDPDLLSKMHAADHTDSSRTATERYDDIEDVRWHSVITPAVYLLGIGSLAPEATDSSLDPPPDWLTNSNDPNYENRNDGAQGLGIRDPGSDHSWGGAVTRAQHRPSFTGRVYGPYIDPRIGEAQVRPVRLDDFTYRTTISPPISESDIELMQLSVIVDRYDTPIRYYKGWPERERTATPAAGSRRVETLIDAPLELLGHDAVAEYQGATDGDAPLIDAGLMGKPCAFLSAGSDARWGERAKEEVPQDALLLGRNARSLSDEDAKAVLKALDDNQRASPQ